MFDWLLPSSINQFPATSFVYSLPYLFIGLILLFCGRKQILHGCHIKIKQSTVIFLISLFILFFGFRWHLMTDTLGYRDEYNQLKIDFSWTSIEAQSWWWDKGFLLFALLFKWMGLSFESFMTVNSIVDCWLLYVVFKKYSINPLLSCLVFLAFLGILMEINLMRNIKAILLFLYSLQYIEQRRFIPFFVVITIAFTFHASSILYLPAYWLLNIRIKPITYICVVTGCTVIMILNDAFIADYINPILDASYLITEKAVAHSMSETTRALSIGTIERVVTVVLLIYVKSKDSSVDNYYSIFVNMFIIFYAFFCFFNFNEVFVDRFSTLYIPAYWFAYPYIYRYFFKKKYIRYALLLFFFVKIYTSTQMSAAYYENRLFTTSSYIERSVLLDKCR